MMNACAIRFCGNILTYFYYSGLWTYSFQHLIDETGFQSNLWIYATMVYLYLNISIVALALSAKVAMS
jgi:hypothetical protein